MPTNRHTHTPAIYTQALIGFFTRMAANSADANAVQTCFLVHPSLPIWTPVSYLLLKLKRSLGPEPASSLRVQSLTGQVATKNYGLLMWQKHQQADHELKRKCTCSNDISSIFNDYLKQNQTKYYSSNTINDHDFLEVPHIFQKYDKPVAYLLDIFHTLRDKSHLLRMSVASRYKTCDWNMNILIHVSIINALLIVY